MAGQAIKPVFIFSLPRSGSTLLQRLLATNDEIVTASETWLLLPLLYMKREDGVFSEYGHRASVTAIKDFILELPQTDVDFNQALRKFVLSLYEKAGHKKVSARYFLDKTPRYHLICDELVELFPEAKLIFLWRNPLAIAASIIDTFGRGKWQLDDYRVDLYDGMSRLVDCYRSVSDRALSVRFEDLVTSSQREIERLAEYLDVKVDVSDINDFSKVVLKGRMGDPSGTVRYKSISSEPLEKWPRTLASPMRRRWAKKYLEWIGEERLAEMGYKQSDIYGKLIKQPVDVRYVFSDMVRVVLGKAQCAFELRMLERKLKNSRKGLPRHGHT